MTSSARCCRLLISSAVQLVSRCSRGDGVITTIKLPEQPIPAEVRITPSQSAGEVHVELGRCVWFSRRPHHPCGSCPTVPKERPHWSSKRSNDQNSIPSTRTKV